MVHDDRRPPGRTCLYPWKTLVDPAPPPGCGHDALPPVAPAPAVEIAVVEEDEHPAESAVRRATIEIWTRNRVYLLDAGLVCLDVTCRDTGEPDEAQRCRGSRLVGARRRVDDALEFWRPLPVPGSLAIFSSSGAPGGESVATTPVERVVLRQRVRRAPLDPTASEGAG